MWCPGCGTEYPAGSDRCTTCDVSLLREASQPPSTVFKVMGARLAGALIRYEQGGGTDPLADVVATGEWSSSYRPDLSLTPPSRPAARWELVFEQSDERMVVVGQPGGAWRVGVPRVEHPPVYKDFWSREFDRDALAAGIRGIPRGVWVAVIALAAAVAAVLVWRDAPSDLRILAGLAALFVLVAVVSLAPRSMRHFFRGFPQAALGIVLVIGVTYVMIGASTGLHVGLGWPMNAWLDLFENDTVLVDVISEKREDHYEICGRYGCTPVTDYWITAGGEEWPVSRSTFALLDEGEVVEIGYRPHTHFVEYVAYGPGLSATRGTRQLRVAVALAPAERRVLEEEVLPQFTKRTGYAVTFLQMDTDTLMTVLEDEGGSPFDLLAVDNNRVGQLAADHLVLDLSDHADLVPSTVLPSLRSLIDVDGRTMFLPFRPNVMVTYYDAPTFADLGRTPPRDWSELLEVATALDPRSNGLVLHGERGPPSATQLTELLWQAGGDPLHLDSPASRQALDFLAELAAHLDSQTKQAQFDTIDQFLADGEAALAPNWTFGVSEVVLDGHHDNIKVYPGWTGPASGAHVLGGDVLAVPRHAPRPKAALALASYLMSKPVQQRLADELFWPPVRTDIDHRSTPTLQPYWDAIDEALSEARPRPAVACWSDVERVLSSAWHQIVTERKVRSASISYWSNEISAWCEPRTSNTTQPAEQTKPADQTQPIAQAQPADQTQPAERSVAARAHDADIAQLGLLTAADFPAGYVEGGSGSVKTALQLSPNDVSAESREYTGAGSTTSNAVVVLPSAAAARAKYASVSSTFANPELFKAGLQSAADQIGKDPAVDSISDSTSVALRVALGDDSRAVDAGFTVHFKNGETHRLIYHFYAVLVGRAVAVYIAHGSDALPEDVDRSASLSVERLATVAR